MLSTIATVLPVASASGRASARQAEKRTATGRRGRSGKAGEAAHPDGLRDLVAADVLGELELHVVPDEGNGAAPVDDSFDTTGS
jgi:hypothetical protein